MTHLAKFALLGAVALLAAVGCQREPVVDNPNFNAETNEVLTDVILSIATGPDTKQSAAVVQQAEGETAAAFRGIDNAILLSYAKEGSNGKILVLDEAADKLHNMDVAATAGYFGPGESRRVYEMALPLNSNILLFYGKAIRPAQKLEDTEANIQENRANNQQFGYMSSYVVNDKANSARFTLGRRMTPADTTAFYTIERLIAGIGTLIMNSHISASISATGIPATGVAPYGFDITAAEYGGEDGTIYWKEYDRTDKKSPVQTEHEWYPLEKKLGEAYHRMTYIRSADGELRAGSAEAIGRMMSDLWTIVNEVRCAEPMNKYEAVAKRLATEIHSIMGTYFTATVPDESGPVSNFKVKTIEEINEVFNDASQVAKRPTTVAANKYPTWLWPTTAQLTAVEGYKLNEFPFNFGLPRGATHIAFNTTKDFFYYPYYFNTDGMGGVTANGNFSAISYYYPAELMYFGNSPIRTSDTDKKATEYPQGSGTTAPTETTPGQWMAEGSWDGWKNNAAVTSATRAVAMKYNVNYGTALLQTQVKYAVTELEDNNHFVQAQLNGVGVDDPLVANEKNKVITPTESTFKLTGVIVGGASTDLGWDYLPIKSQMDTPEDASDDKYMTGFIYDNSLSADQQVIPATGLSKEVYTLVPDNFLHDAVPFKDDGTHNPAATQSTVYVALEFQNNSGQDLYGNYSMIRNGGFFYLIGELKPGAETATVTWPETGYKYPPYNATGGSQEINRVFIQDYLTKATFKFGRYSLQHAYLTVPDLRAGSMSLGLSVDLSWENGLVFETVLGGDTATWFNP